jgi:hypothetical protein
MLEVASVGADLTPVQQDETLDDLAFFLDELGSTRAVRVKLQEQENDIKRLKDQVRRLVDVRSGNFHAKVAGNDTNCEQPTTKGCTHASEDADETMAHLDFFLRTYGSTRAVREKLRTNKSEIAGLQRKIKWLQERWSRADRREDSSDAGVEYVGTVPASGSTLEKRDEQQDGARTPDTSDDVSKKASGVVIALSSCETGCHADEARDDHVTSPPYKPSESLDAVVPASAAALCTDKSPEPGGGATERVESQQTCTEDWPLGIKGLNGAADPRHAAETPSAATTTKKIKKRCRVPGCEKWYQVHGLCAAHGGRRTCKVDGCSLKAVTRHLCRHHGGGTICSTAGCEKITVSGGHGHCYKHALDHGFEIKAKCKAGGCSRQRVGQQYCQRHRDPKPPSLHSESSEHVDKPRSCHVTCKAVGCRKWVKRSGDTNEYCGIHEAICTSSERGSTATANQAD